MQYEIEKFIIIHATKCVLWPSDSLKIVCDRGSAPDPAGGAYDAPQTSSRLGGEHLSTFPTPLYAFGVSPLDVFGVSLRRLNPSLSAVKNFP